MSHFQKFDCKVTNKTHLIKALNQMGYGVAENVLITDYFKNNVKVDVAIVREGKKLCIGFAKEEQEREYKLVADWYAQKVNQKNFTNRLNQLNTQYLVEDICEDNGWFIDSEDIVVNEKNEVEILAIQYV